MKYEDLREFLFKIIKIADDIGVKYKQLKTIEQSGMTNEILYKNTCAELVNLRFEENKIYKHTPLSREDTFKLIGMIIHEFKFNPNQTIEDLLHISNKFDGYKRVFFILNNRINYDIDNSFKAFSSSYGVMSKVLSEKVYKQKLRSIFMYQESILNNYYLVLENFISKYLETATEFKERLIHIKYLIPFLNLKIEDEFKKNGFIFKDDLFLSYTLVGDFAGIPRKVQNLNLNEILFRIFALECDKILNVSDEIMSKYRFNVLLSEMIMRSITVFFEEEFLIDRKQSFEDFMKKNYSNYLQHNDAIQCILRVYNSTKKDKSKYKYLSSNPL